MSYLRRRDEDFEALREEHAHNLGAILIRSCCDGLCGALDCVRCRGDEALEFISAEEE